ncbi:YraN family protein [Lentisphaerota bacterium WC36G]|nr:YraN family protein [Lentisphaerae bacterium WC36]
MSDNSVINNVKKQMLSHFLFFKRRAPHIKLGAKGESIATNVLKDKYYNILMRNYRNARGEIDIVARDGDTLVFVEVKSRTFHELYKPLDNFSYKQRKRIKNSAKYYIKSLGSPDFKCRFDFIEIIFTKQNNLQEIYHHCDFF